jgi:hypothetical protein
MDYINAGLNQGKRMDKITMPAWIIQILENPEVQAVIKSVETAVDNAGPAKGFQKSLSRVYP